MKKIIKATAAFLTLSLTLTACTNNSASEPLDGTQPSSSVTKSTNDVQIDKKAVDIYLNSPVTQVEKQPYTINGVEGVYTGDWKGNRPEGHGKFIIGEYDYYTGEWYNGMLLGKGEIQRTYDDGTWKRFEGECAYNLPSGEGQMFIGSDNDNYCTEVNGNFGDESTLMFYTTDENGKLVDIGDIQDNAYVSYLGDPNIKGKVTFTDWVRMNFEYVASGWEGYEGTYMGQVDENDVPNGYGYSVSSKYSTTVYKLGTWKDGMIDGYYTEWRNDGGLWTTRMGTIKDGKDVGEYIVYEEKAYYNLVKKENCDTSYTYTLCDDGIYRTDYTIEEYYFKDGRYTYQKYLTFKTDMNDREFYYEGEYASSDAQGNLISCGEADPEATCTLDWVSYEEARKKKLWDTLAPVVATGILVGVGAYIFGSWGKDFENSAASNMLNNTREELARDKAEDDLHDELIEKAKEEERLGNYYDANKYYEEAKQHGRTLFGF